MKKSINCGGLFFAAFSILLVILSPAWAETYRDGVYDGNSRVIAFGKVRLQVVIEGGRIKDIKYLEIPDWEPEKVKTMMRERIIEEQSTRVDGVTGATESCELIIEAVDGALKGASIPSDLTAGKSVEPAPRVVLETTRGRIELLLYPEKAPRTVENFIGLVEKGYYDGIIFHRVIPGFMIQGGDPTGTGRGGSSLWGKPFEDEFNPDLRFDRPGLLAMANAGPNTNGSQFFITTVKTPHLNDHHTIFGEVVEGYDVVQAIEKTPTGRGNRPRTEQKILKATLIRGAN